MSKGESSHRKRLRLLSIFVLVLGIVSLWVVAASAQEAALTGDVETGKALYTGEQRLENGGPPCISCHNTGVGQLGGGVLAPDLSKVYEDPAKRALLNVAWANSPGTPVMGPIFSAKNITEQEMEHLKAFFQQISKQPQTAAPTGSFVIIGVIGFIAILVLFSIIWRGRYSQRNQGTVHDALWRNYGGIGGR